MIYFLFIAKIFSVNHLLGDYYSYIIAIDHDNFFFRKLKQFLKFLECFFGGDNNKGTIIEFIVEMQ